MVSFRKGCKFAAAKNGNEFSEKFIRRLLNYYKKGI